jgi:phage-related tail protein
MVDALGVEIVPGDVVVFSTMDSASLQLGLVTKLTPKGLRIIFPSKWGSSTLRDMAKSGDNVAKVDKTAGKAPEFLKQVALLQLTKDFQ